MKKSRQNSFNLMSKFDKSKFTYEESLTVQILLSNFNKLTPKLP